MPSHRFSACLAILLGTVAFAAAPPARMPRTGLAPAKRVLDQCVLRYRISTTSSACQDYFDQGLGYWYSYVWMEASRSFETAIQHDPHA
ncbi:MAG: hypothetical protein U0736_16790 [Gemmataceae bacterium]